MIKTDYLIIYDDGAIEIFGNKEGMPEVTGVLPAPDLNTKSERDRQERFDEACDQLTVKGYYIKSKRRIKNTVFDKPGQKTTLKVVYRPCKTKEEMRIVTGHVMRILARLAEDQDEERRRNFLVENPEFLEVG